MGTAYSEDLRERVLAAIASGMSKMTAHKTFGVSRSTLDDWLQLRAQQGHLRPHTVYQHGPVPVLSDLVAFRDFAQRHQHATLAQMAHAWHLETGRHLSLMPFSKALRRIGWTHKKRVICIENVAPTNAKSS